MSRPCATCTLGYSKELVPDNLLEFASGQVIMGYQLGGITIPDGAITLQSSHQPIEVVIIPRLMWDEVDKKVREMFALVDKEKGQ